MTTGRLVAVFLVLSGILAGAGMYYLQVYAYYDRLPAQSSFPLTPEGAAGPEEVEVAGFEAIDSESSPIRYRACFTLPQGVPDGLQGYARPTPLIAPRWFGCFDAGGIARALSAGEAQAVLSVGNVIFGIDRVAALFPDGRGYAWHQINPCGEAFFDGDPLPTGCPSPPSRAQE